jgi:hypothetical protein
MAALQRQPTLVEIVDVVKALIDIFFLANLWSVSGWHFLHQTDLNLKMNFSNDKSFFISNHTSFSCLVHFCLVLQPSAFLPRHDTAIKDLQSDVDELTNIIADVSNDLQVVTNEKIGMNDCITSLEAKYERIYRCNDLFDQLCCK